MFSPLGHISRTGHQMRRLAPILSVLARHGFGHMAYRFSFHHYVPARFGGRGPSEQLSAPRRFRRVLEDLGPAFIKFGQMLSTRADILPEEYLDELRQLTEHVPPFPTEAAREIIETDLKKPITELFLDFAPEPVASGSIGQVYYATLLSGEKVVVKVRRPDIEKTILADLDLLDFTAPIIDRFEEFKPLRLPMIVDEFRRSIMRELDFVSEASFTAKVGEDFAENPNVCVPAVHWNLTTNNVLVLERLDGVSLNRRDEIAQLPLDRKKLARDLVETFLNQFFKTGLFHADPHAGNILVMHDGRIGLVDFGMSGRLDSELRNHLATSFIALSRRDLDIITDIYLEIGAISEETDVARLKADLQESLDKYYGIPIHSLDLRRCFSDAMRVARVHRVLLPRDFVLLGKSFVTMVMMARELDPDFDLAAVARPYALTLLADKVSPRTLLRDAAGQAWYISQGLRRLPRDLRTFMRKALAGSLQLTLRVREFESFIRELDKATNRIAFSLIVSAIVVGSSIILHARIPPYVNWLLPGRLGQLFAANMPELSALGLAGFLVAGFMGMLLILAIWRSGRL